MSENTDVTDRIDNHLKHIKQLNESSKQTAGDILSNLHDQRITIEKSMDKINLITEKQVRSDSILVRIIRKENRYKLLVGLIIVILIIIIMIVAILTATKSK